MFPLISYILIEAKLEAMGTITKLLNSNWLIEHICSECISRVQTM